MEDLEFNEIRNLVNYRYFTGLSDMSEILELTKIDLSNSIDNCAKRLFAMGYGVMDTEIIDESINIKPSEISVFTEHLQIALKRYLVKKSKNLKEVLAVVKLIVNEDKEHSVRRLNARGHTVFNPNVKSEGFDPSNAFADILGGVYDPTENMENDT